MCNYIVDFYCAELKLVVEVDGTQHFLENGRVYDEKREQFLREKGLRVIRYSNADINMRFEDVLNDIFGVACGMK